MVRIVQLQNHIKYELQRIRPGIFYQLYGSTEKGNKIIRGRHICVYVPNDKPISNSVKLEIRTIFDKYFSDMINCIMPVGNHTMGNDPVRYRIINMEY